MNSVQPTTIYPTEVTMTRGQMIAAQGDMDQLDALFHLIGRVIMVVMGVFAALVGLLACCVCCCDDETPPPVDNPPLNRGVVQLHPDFEPDLDFEDEQPEEMQVHGDHLSRLRNYNKPFNLAAGKTHDVAHVALDKTKNKINKQGISEKAANATKGLVFNKEMLGAAPPPLSMKLQKLIQEGRVSEPADPGLLLMCFNTVFQTADKRVYPQDVVVEHRKNMAQLIHIVENRLDAGNRPPSDREYGLTEVMNTKTGDTEPQYLRAYWVNLYNEVYRCLPFLIESLKDPSVDRGDKEAVLISLANAGLNCRPRLEVEFTDGLKKLRKFTDVSLEELFLQRAQIFKEDIIRAGYPKMDATHLLNCAKRLVGNKWGLEVTEASKGDFLNKKQLEGFTEGHFDKVLNANYTPPRLVDVLYTFFSQVPTRHFEYEKVITAYLQKNFPEDDPSEFYEEVALVAAGGASLGTRRKTVYILTHAAIAKFATKMGLLEVDRRNLLQKLWG